MPLRQSKTASSSLSSSSSSTATLESSKQTQALPSLLTSPTTTDTDVSECDCECEPDSHDHDQEHRHEHKHLERCSREPKLCLCEVRRHTTETSCWLVVGQRVYDVTAVLRVHPGGARSILRKAGGVDCTSDMAFHARRAHKTLDACLIGKLERCGDESSTSESSGCCIM